MIFLLIPILHEVALYEPPAIAVPPTKGTTGGNGLSALLQRTGIRHNLVAS